MHSAELFAFGPRDAQSDVRIVKIDIARSISTAGVETAGKGDAVVVTATDIVRIVDVVL